MIEISMSLRLMLTLRIALHMFVCVFVGVIKI